jgi:hypothetical protein
MKRIFSFDFILVLLCYQTALPATEKFSASHTNLTCFSAAILLNTLLMLVWEAMDLVVVVVVEEHPRGMLIRLNFTRLYV